MTEKCPHCSADVLFITDVCPNCQADRKRPVGEVAAERQRGDDAPSVLPWARKEQIGSFAAAWSTVRQGIFFPARVLRITRSDPSGSSFFFYAFGLFCCIPVCAISLALVCLHSVAPDSLHFQDINPTTVLIALPAQFLVGPLALSLLGVSFNVAGGSGSSELKTKVAWYVGTFLWIIGYWWLGLGVALSTARFLHRIDRSETYLLVMMLVAAGLWIRLALTSIKSSFGVSYGSAFFRLLGSAFVFLILTIPIGFLLRLLLNAIL